MIRPHLDARCHDLTGYIPRQAGKRGCAAVAFENPPGPILRTAATLGPVAPGTSRSQWLYRKFTRFILRILPDRRDREDRQSNSAQPVGTKRSTHSRAALGGDDRTDGSPRLSHGEDSGALGWRLLKGQAERPRVYGNTRRRSDAVNRPKRGGARGPIRSAALVRPFAKENCLPCLSP